MPVPPLASQGSLNPLAGGRHLNKYTYNVSINSGKTKTEIANYRHWQNKKRVGEKITNLMQNIKILFDVFSIQNKSRLQS